MNKRSWWQRNTPTKVRHNLWLILRSLAFLIITGSMFSSSQIRPIVFTHETPTQLSNSRYNIVGKRDLFDLSLAHTIKIHLSKDALNHMTLDYRIRGLKTWVKGDVTIDGTLIESVGIRLKGNSTLKSLNEDDYGQFNRDAAFSLSNASFQNPSTLPLLLSFDKYVSGGAYQGKEELAIRPTKNGSTNLNEAMALRLIADTGQVSQNFSWITFSINDYPSATRLVIENPDKRYADSIGLGSGVLYKSRSQNRFEYLGNDQTLYKSDFDQINAKKTYGYSPVIGLLKWQENVSDLLFEQELSAWVNTQNLALYIATQDLLGNFDDMSGPGRNFLLWYDLVDEKFSILAWDMNMALGGSNLIAKNGFSATNPLKERFMKSSLFIDDLVAARLALLELWTSNHTSTVLNELTNAIPVSDMLNQEQIDVDIAAIKLELKKIR